MALWSRSSERDALVMYRLLLAAVAVLMASACGDDIDVLGIATNKVEGSGAIVSETFEVADYQRFQLAGEGRVVFNAAPDGVVIVETDDNLIERIEIDVTDGRLRIATESGIDIDPTDGVTYRLGCPAMESVELTGAGSIRLDGCASPSVLELLLPGAGEIRAPTVATDRLDVSLPGAGSIEAIGSARELDVRISGAGSFDGGNVEASAVTVVSSGVGDAVVWATDSLDIEISGVGDVSYFGDPVVDQRISGIGSIDRLGNR